ncbi:CCDC81 eukaryotic HU domain 2 [Phytophthora infestans]|uniref:CCDC81 eukaryotic HU domain 2 n=1 Tax=Phytophthora infestans TaxID=4787 RepID=A0A8S9V6D8_PHYIN|nr:CCDC81 eukaryotic HU domain 2 [Phytophthora infestans]
MVRSGDLLAECGQQLRSSKFDFEVLLGASVASVWQALGRHVARQLSLRKGVSLHQLGKFGFYKTQTSMLSAQPVFLLSDRLTSTYGFVWRHCSSPAPLTATAEVSMAALGNEAGLGLDQTRRTLDAIVAFVGQRLQGGGCVGKLVLPGVGTFTVDDKALSFTFDSSLLRAITQNNQGEIAPPSAIFRKSPTDLLRKKAMQLKGEGEITVLQRSLSLDGPLQTTNKSKLHLKAKIESNIASHRDDLTTPKKRRNDIEPRESRSIEQVSPNRRQILPRFLMPESRVPPDMLKTRPAHDQVMQAAYQREVASIRQAKCVDVQFNKLLAHRQRVVHIQDLQKRAEESVAQKELNAFLSSQIEVKRHRSRLKSASADHRAIKILPLERVMGDEMKRSEKKKLNQRLNEQVAAKAALKKDKRTLDQAETAYFISKLKIQDDIDRHEVAERKRIEKATLLAGWSQQKALRAQKSARG